VADPLSRYSQDVKPISEKPLEAKVTDVFHYGYSVEANIDGKLLRGLLFTYKPGYAHAVQAHILRLAKLSMSFAFHAKVLKQGGEEGGWVCCRTPALKAVLGKEVDTS
jgi:hypothetical protein